MAAILSTAILSPTDAQELGVRVVTTCGATSPWPSFVNSFNYGWFTVDPNGNLCTSGGGGGGGGGAITAPLGHATADTAAVSVVPSATATFPVTGTFWQATQPVSAAGLPLPSGASTSSNQTNASQKTQIVDGSGNVIGSTSNNFNVQCANCSGSGVSTGDEATFTAGSSLFAGSGGFFQTTPTNNSLTTGQQGMLQVTANRAVFSNLRNAAGTEVGTSTTPLLVSLANTAANATAVKVDGSAVTQPVSGTGTFATQSAITAASGAVASGAVASGAYASGAFASGSISDGAEVTLGAKADAKNTATDTTAITAMQVWKEISAMEQAPASRAVTNTGTFATQSAITAASGSIASGAIASGAVASGAFASGSIGSGAVASGAVASGAYASGSIADGAEVTIGAKADAKSTSTDTTAITIMQVLKEISAMEQAPVGRSPYPVGATAETASTTGTTAATTATLATAIGKTTYICSLSIRANATAAVTGNATVTGTITGTLNFTQWTAPLASGLGVTEQIFTPCVPASTTNTSIAVVSAAPGSGGVVSVTATGYQL